MLQKAKSLDTIGFGMVGTTGIEPVTPTMSTYVAPLNSLKIHGRAIRNLGKIGRKQVQSAACRLIRTGGNYVRRALSWIRWLFTPMPPRPCAVCGRSDGEMCADCANHWSIK